MSRFVTEGVMIWRWEEEDAPEKPKNEINRSGPIYPVIAYATR